MKILTVSNCLLRMEEGSGSIILGYSHGLQQLGHEVILKGPDDYEIFQLARPRANTWRQMLGMYWRVPQWVDFHQPDIVEFYGAEGALAIEKLRQRKQRPLLVHHTNGPEIRYGLPSRQGPVPGAIFKRRYIPAEIWRKSFTHADRVVTVSKTDEAWLLRNTPLRQDQLKAIENPISEHFFEQAENKSDGRSPVIGYCGTWIPRKGIAVMGQDISRILQEYPRAKFRIVGGHHEFKISDYFAPDVLDRVESLGVIRDKVKLREFYCQCSIFILPSVAESFGLALAEAMACGCAGVAGKGVGFASTLTDAEEVLLMEESKSPLLYQSVKRLLDNEELRLKLSLAGCRRVQGLRWQQAIVDLAETYALWSSEYTKQ